jgi:hypothetical protein
MPVNETIEMCESIRELLNIPVGYIIINSIFPQVLKKRDTALFSTMKKRAQGNGLKKLTKAERKYLQATIECFESAVRRRELNEFYISKLKRKLKHDFMLVPFMFTKSFDIDLIEKVSNHMMESIEKGRSGK